MEFNIYDMKLSNAFYQLQINSEADYEDRLQYVERLMEVVNSGNEKVLPLLDYVSKLIEDYEDIHYPVEDSTPARMLSYFMDQHDHKQVDLVDIASQSIIREILNGKRVPTPEQVKKLAEKYHTSPEVFL